MAKTLPPYFQKYLDDKFDFVSDAIEEVRAEVGDIVTEMKRMNGSIASTGREITNLKTNRKSAMNTYVPQFKATRKKVDMNRKCIICLVVLFIVMSILLIRNGGTEVIKAAIGLLSTLL